MNLPALTGRIASLIGKRPFTAPLIPTLPDGVFSAPQIKKTTA